MSYYLSPKHAIRPISDLPDSTIESFIEFLLKQNGYHDGSIMTGLSSRCGVGGLGRIFRATITDKIRETRRHAAPWPSRREPADKPLVDLGSDRAAEAELAGLFYMAAVDVLTRVGDAQDGALERYFNDRLSTHSRSYTDHLREDSGLEALRRRPRASAAPPRERFDLPRADTAYGYSRTSSAVVRRPGPRSLPFEEIPHQTLFECVWAVADAIRTTAPGDSDSRMRSALHDFADEMGQDHVLELDCEDPSRMTLRAWQSSRAACMLEGAASEVLLVYARESRATDETSYRALSDHRVSGRLVASNLSRDSRLQEMLWPGSRAWNRTRRHQTWG